MCYNRSGYLACTNTVAYWMQKELCGMVKSFFLVCLVLNYVTRGRKRETSLWSVPYIYTGCYDDLVSRAIFAANSCEYHIRKVWSAHDVYFQGFNSISVVTYMCSHGTYLFTDKLFAMVFVRRTQQESEKHDISPRAPGWILMRMPGSLWFAWCGRH